MNIPRLLFRLLLGRRLPTTSGTIQAPAIQRPVTIKRDRYGIPCIEAETDNDAWYGIGFCQGQDRAFKLEILLRVVRGTLAELIGLRGIAIDQLSRRIGFLHTAKTQLKTIDPAFRAMIEAFTRGVNDGSRLGCRRVAHEFTLLRARPTPYTAEDVVAVYLLQAFVLASNWDIELARLRILREDGPEAVMALDPAYPEWHPISSAIGEFAGQAADRLAEDLALFAETVGAGGASNNWAIAPSRTITGRPILSNDPHLQSTLPPHWYLAHVRTPEWAIVGAALTGLPVFPMGHNGRVAWGITVGLADNSDLFIEEIGPDRRSVREEDRFVPCITRREMIRVKGGEDVIEDVLITPRGPIIGPAPGDEDRAISLRATWLDPLPVNGFLNAHRAGSVEEFRLSFEDWPHISLNVAFADTSGAIGWQLVGQVPRRRRGWGTIPMAGWERKAGWEGELISFEEMPGEIDPPQGFVATANNKPMIDQADPFLGIDWLDGYRFSRIVEVLNSRKDWDVASANQLQMDRQSLPWREIREMVLSAPAGNENARLALALLQEWDGVLSDDSPGATVFEFFLSEMVRRVARAKAPRSWETALGRGGSVVQPLTLLAGRRVGHLVRLMRDRHQGWFDVPWEQIIGEALTAAVGTIRGTYGDDQSRWGWGNVRTLTLRHPVGDRGILGRVFNLGPFPWGGDTNTISQAAVNPFDTGASPLVVASARMVLDVGNWEENLFALPGGQSGNPLSPHYADLLPLWRRGAGVRIPWASHKVEEAAISTLRLLPVH